MKKLLITLSLTMALMSCSIMQPAADIGIAAAQYPTCRVALIDYLPDNVLTSIKNETRLIDETQKDLMRQVTERPEIRLVDALQRVAGAAQEVSYLESAYGVIETTTLQYAYDSDTPVPQLLETCNDDMKAGWEALIAAVDSVSAAEYLALAAPYARLLPLLLQNEQSSKRALPA